MSHPGGKEEVRRALCAAAIAGCVALSGCGKGLFGGGGGGGKNQTQPATGLTAIAGNSQVTLNWDAYPGATDYGVERSTTNGGPYSYINANKPTLSTATTYTDPDLTNGTTYYYVVVADGSWGVSNPSNQASATPTGPTTSIDVSVNVLANAHYISPYIYGGAFPKDTTTITNTDPGFSGPLIVRWGGNGSSTYNWQLHTYNSDNDYYFEDFPFCGLGGPLSNSACSDGDSVQFIKDIASGGGIPIMTMPMLPWVAQSAEASGNGHWSFSASRDGAQCRTDPQNADAGDGIELTANCNTQPTYLTASPADINDAYVPLLDDHSQACTAGAGCVYRSDWVAALTGAFVNGLPHFYDLDNEMDIWGSTHRDIHPNPSGYDEMASVYETEATKLKGWDSLAVRLGPVSCCWWYYWNGANSNDKAEHGGDDFLPWWLNQIYWEDEISGTRSLEVFDVHAYPDATTTDNQGNPLPKTQLQSLATSIYRDYWDPTFVSPSASINQQFATNIQPNKTIPFRIPRLRAIVNTIYPGTQMSVTEWSAPFAGESDFSTALGDADAYGILGRERVYLAPRWTMPNPANPNYWALALYTNADGQHDLAFAGESVADTNNGDPDLFSSYAVYSGSGLKIMVINKDPLNGARVQFTISNFTPTNYTSYVLTSAAPTTIEATDSQSWQEEQEFPPYSVTMLSISGSGPASAPASWDLNPDTIMVPAGGSAALQTTTAGQGPNVTITSAVFDAYQGAAACAGSISITNPTITSSQAAQFTANPGATPGFCHFTVTGTDGGGNTESQGGWIVVGNPAASLTITSGNNQTGARATTLPVALTVSLAPGNSGGANPANGASILFSANAGSLSNGTTSGSKLIAITSAMGTASVTLTLPAGAQSVTVTAEGPYGLGHPVATFNETSQ